MTSMEHIQRFLSHTEMKESKIRHSCGHLMTLIEIHNLMCAHVRPKWTSQKIFVFKNSLSFSIKTQKLFDISLTALLSNTSSLLNGIERENFTRQITSTSFNKSQIFAIFLQRLGFFYLFMDIKVVPVSSSKEIQMRNDEWSFNSWPIYIILLRGKRMLRIIEGYDDDGNKKNR